MRLRLFLELWNLPSPDYIQKREDLLCSNQAKKSEVSHKSLKKAHPEHTPPPVFPTCLHTALQVCMIMLAAAWGWSLPTPGSTPCWLSVCSHSQGHIHSLTQNHFPLMKGWAGVLTQLWGFSVFSFSFYALFASFSSFVLFRNFSVTLILIFFMISLQL